jgi:glycerol kinase
VSGAVRSHARSPVVLAVDAGTTGVRALVIDDQARVVDTAYRELTQHFPRPGWVEHDADEIRSLVGATLAEVAGRLGDGDRQPVAMGITNQRETVVAWDRRNGSPRHRAIVWQDRRTLEACRELEARGMRPLIRERTGLVPDPYFSGTKMHWLLEEGGVAADEHLALATVDSWVLWNLTGGAGGGTYATDVTNASRTMLFDIRERRWSEELADVLGVPLHSLPEVRPSAGDFGRVPAAGIDGDGLLAGLPVGAMVGDQHAALFGQACFDLGMTKVTFGTGTFIVMQAGGSCPDPVEGLVTTVAWDLGGEAGMAYALEGSVFASGAGVQWLRDGLGLIAAAAELEPLARSVDSSGGVVLVPAFTGLGSPTWDPTARGTITGLSRGTGRAHLARAMVEAMAFQARDVLDAMAGTGIAPTGVRVDGGAAVMDLLLQELADQSRLAVVRPRSVETTAVGAATMAGLSVGLWSSLDELAGLWREDAAFSPVAAAGEADRLHEGWQRSVERSRRWALADDQPTADR